MLMWYGGFCIHSLTRERNVPIVLHLQAEECVYIPGRDKDSSVCAASRQTVGIDTRPIEWEFKYSPLSVAKVAYV
jgi:hypothetical protein